MFDKLPNYFGQQKFIIDKIKFFHLDGWYEGKGYLFWEVEKGFRIEAFIERKGKPLTGSFSPREGIARKDEIVTLRMKLRGGYWAIAPRVLLANRIFNDYSETQLSTSVSHVIFSGTWFENPRDRKQLGLNTDRVVGEAFFQTSRKFNLTDATNYEIKIGGNDFRRGSNSDAFRTKSDEYTVTGYYIKDTCIKVEFSLRKKEKQGNAYVRAWLDALGLSLSFYLGETIELLHSNFGDYKRRFMEYRKLDSVRMLDSYKPFNDVFTLNSQDIINLANFLARESLEAKVCRNIYLQIIEAAQQKSWAASELLLATILEAAFRTLNHKPFVEGQAQDNSIITRGLSDFFRDNIFNSVTDEQQKRKWREVKNNVLKFHEKLRHRNAHPDWLIGTDDTWSHEQAEEAFYMQRFIARFYGYMILALAGCKDLQPHFPLSPKEEKQIDQESDSNSGLGVIAWVPQFQILKWT